MTLCSCGVEIHALQMPAHLGGKRHNQELARRGKRPAAAAPSPAAPASAAPPPAAQLSSADTSSRSTRVGSRQDTGPNPTAAPPARVSVPSSPAAAQQVHLETYIHCQLCDRDVLRDIWTLHLASDAHLRNQSHATVQSVLETAEHNRNDIEVQFQGGIDFGVVEPERVAGLSAPRMFEVAIRNTKRTTEVSLSEMRFSYIGGSGRFSVTFKGDSKWITFGRYRSVVVTLEPSPLGRYQDFLELTFVDAKRKERFCIVRRVAATVGVRADHEELRPEAPYVKPTPRPHVPPSRVIPVTRPPQWTATKWVNFLPEYPVPKALDEAMDEPKRRKAHKNINAEFLPSAFNITTYGKFFQTLLHVEEIMQTRQLESYTMYDVPLTPMYPRYSLDVPGLAENRPSVLVGDIVRIRRTDATDNIWQDGIVHNVGATSVQLRFDNKFNTYKGTRFDVRFVLNRMPMRRMHQAVTSANNPERILFPNASHTRNHVIPKADQIRAINLVNRKVDGDDEQYQTVLALLNRPPGSIPFILFGPPGTGKTLTLVESIQQLIKNYPDVRILACAPSNSAADEIALRLLSLGPSQLFRLNALSRDYNHLPKTLRPFAQVNGNLVFAMPTLDSLRKYRVVVSTCLSASVPFGLGIPPGHFSHIFVDECGQATEPEAMVPVKSMVDHRTNVILAGDPKQLGPIVNVFLRRDLGISYLDRLASMPVYDLAKYGGKNIVKLVKNWRSHPAILEYVNGLFYDGELQPCGDPVITHSMLRSDALVKEAFPVVFHAVHGKDEREKQFPSFFNIDEASMVKHYCDLIRSDRKIRITDADIGVISPYRAQCHKIIKLLQTPRTDGIKVGSVEEFQGQERRVIIISTVRSNTDFIEPDLRRHLGFVADPRRFNVAVTRAQALLIVIGNPRILRLDPVWREFMRWVHDRGGWRGTPYANDMADLDRDVHNADTEQMNRAQREAEEMRLRLQSMILSAVEMRSWIVPDGDASDAGSESDGAEGAEDQPWRYDLL